MKIFLKVTLVALALLSANLIPAVRGDGETTAAAEEEAFQCYDCFNEAACSTQVDCPSKVCYKGVGKNDTEDFFVWGCLSEATVEDCVPEANNKVAEYLSGGGGAPGGGGEGAAPGGAAPAPGGGGGGGAAPPPSGGAGGGGAGAPAPPPSGGAAAPAPPPPAAEEPAAEEPPEEAEEDAAEERFRQEPEEPKVTIDQCLRCEETLCNEAMQQVAPVRVLLAAVVALALAAIAH